MTRPRIAVILNGISKYKRSFYKHWLPKLEVDNDVDVFETQQQDHAIELAASAAAQHYKIIIAAGGDGTLNQVVNGLIFSGVASDQLPILTVLPFGSGNDFVRSTKIPSTPEDFVHMLNARRSHPVDIGYVRCVSQSQKITRYFLNVADCGMGPAVVKRVANKRTFLEGVFAYYLSIIQTFLTFKPIKISVQTEGWTWKGTARSLAVANGKYYGHGLCIAPKALLDDRIFNVFICGDVSVVDFIKYSSTLKKGKHLSIPDVHYKTATSVTLTSGEICEIETDGEIIGTLPAEIFFAEDSLKMLIGL